jgi:hypothetical protein
MALFASLPAFSQEAMLLGSWSGDDRYSAAVYGTLKITKTKLSWGGHDKIHPRCTVDYTIEGEPHGATFSNQTEQIFTTAPDSKVKTYLLKVSAAECTGGFTHLRLTFELAPNYDYLAVVEYAGLDSPVGSTHFERLPPPRQ